MQRACILVNTSQSFVSVRLLKVKNTLKQGEVLKSLKLKAKPMVFKILKRSWKKSWKVMEFEVLKRVLTL